VNVLVGHRERSKLMRRRRFTDWRVSFRAAWRTLPIGSC
jgi:hypothetical protein